MGSPSENELKLPSEIEDTPTPQEVYKGFLGPIQPSTPRNYAEIFDLPAPMQSSETHTRKPPRLNPAQQFTHNLTKNIWGLRPQPESTTNFPALFKDPVSRAIGKGIMWPINWVAETQGAVNSLWLAELSAHPEYNSGMASIENIIIGPDRLREDRSYSEALAGAHYGASGLALSNLLFNPGHAGVDNLSDFKERYEKYYAENREKGWDKTKSAHDAGVRAYNETPFPLEYQLVAETLGPELFLPYDKPFKALSIANKIKKFHKLSTSAKNLWAGGLSNLSPDEIALIASLSRKELVELNAAGFIKYNPKNNTIKVRTNPTSKDGQKILSSLEKYTGPKDPNLPFAGSDIYQFPGGSRTQPLPGQATYTQAYDETLGLGTQAGRDPNASVVFKQQQEIENYIDLSRKAALSKSFDEIDNLGNPFNKRRNIDELDIKNANNLTSEIPTNPAILGKSNTSWTVPEVINALSVGAKNGTRTVFKQSDEMELIQFIRENGIDPYMSSDPKIGTTRISPTDNTKEFYLAAFDNPNKPGVQAGLYSRPFQRQYVMYRPNDNTFTIRPELDDLPVAYDAETNKNIQALIDAETLKYDNAILQVNQTNQNAIAGGKAWKEARAQIAELNAQKRNKLFELEQREVNYYPETKPIAISATPSEKGAFNLMFEKMYAGKKASEMPFVGIQPGITRPQKVTFAEGTLSLSTFRRGFTQNTITRPDPNNVYSNIPGTEAQYEGFYMPLSSSEMEMNNIMMQEINNAFKNKTITDAWKSTVEIIARRRGLPKPPIPHITAAATGTFDSTPGGFDNVLNGLKGLDEKEADKIIQRMEGMRNTGILELNRFVERGNRLLLDLGIGEKALTIEGRSTVKINQAEIEEFMARLHDDGPIDPKLQPVYDELMKIRDLEQSEYIEFFPDYGLTDMKNVFDSNPNYFPQMWIPPKGVIRTENGWDFVRANPNLKQRLDIPWEEKIADGWKPISWNPFELMMLRRVRGIEHRESLIVLNKLKQNGMALPHNPDVMGKFPTGLNYRIPRVGPSFEGVYQINAKTGQPTRVGVYYVPDYVANLLENSHGWTNRAGNPFSVQVGKNNIESLFNPLIGGNPKVPGVSVYPAVSWSPLDFLAKTSRGLKQTILGLTPYQDLDLIQRALGAGTGRGASKTLDFMVGTAPPRIQTVKMVKDPITGTFRTETKLEKVADLLTGRRRNPLISSLALMPRILVSRLYPGDFYGMGRGGITNRILDSGPLYPDFPITYRHVAEWGWNIEGDTSILRKNLAQSIDDFENGLNIATRNSEIVQARLKQIRNYLNDGLFQGTYRETQMYLIDNVIIPELREKFPLAGVDEIAARTADNINIMTSSQGSWQSAVKNPNVRQALNTVIFSPNETETWIKAFSRMFKGDYKSLYGKYWMGAYINMAVVGNLINYWSTGEAMSIDMYSPIKMRDENDGWDIGIPGVKYNEHFMSPIISKARNGLPVKLDLVNQFDTPIHWMTDAQKAIGNRASPLINMARPWASGTTFYGEPLESAMDKFTYNFYSNLPMSIWQSLKTSENYFPWLENLLPEEETGIGEAQAIQISGMNVKRMTVAEMFDELARREGFEKTPLTWKNAVLNFDGDEVKGILNSQMFDPDSYSPGRDMKEEYWPNQIASALTKPHNQDLSNEFLERSITGLNRGQEFSQLDKFQRDKMDLEQKAVDEVKINKTFSGAYSFWNTIQDINRDYHTKVSALDEVKNLFDKMPSIEDYANEAEYEEALKDHRPKEPLPAARWDYYKIFDDATNDFNQVDWDQVDYQIRKHEDEIWTQEQIEHIDLQINESDYYATHVPYVADLYERKRKHKAYFDLMPHNMEINDMKHLWKEWTEYAGANDPDTFMDMHPEFKRIYNGVKKEEKIISNNDPDLFDLLKRIGRIPPYSQPE